MIRTPAAGSPGGGDRGGDGTITWRELLEEARERIAALVAGDAGAASSDATRIVEEAAGVPAAQLGLVLDEQVTDRAIARFDSMLARRLAGEPLQYVLGHWGFRSLDLLVDHRVLIPRPETETVVEVALRELDRIGGREVSTTVVDLGTGSGAIALSIATERVRTRVWATDASPEALEVARANLAGSGRAATRVTVLSGSWFEALPSSLRRSAQLVVSNPPYVPEDASLPGEVADWEPRQALVAGHDGLDDLQVIVAGAGEWLDDTGVLVCELSPDQAGRVAELARGHFTDVRVEADLAGRDRALVAAAPKR